jgi:hypothetical protein
MYVRRVKAAHKMLMKLTIDCLFVSYFRCVGTLYAPFFFITLVHQILLVKITMYYGHGYELLFITARQRIYPFMITFTYIKLE